MDSPSGFISSNHGKILCIPWFGGVIPILILNWIIAKDSFLLRVFHPLFFAEGYSGNSQQVCWDFTISLDQSDSTTQACHVRIQIRNN